MNKLAKGKEGVMPRGLRTGFRVFQMAYLRKDRIRVDQHTNRDFFMPAANAVYTRDIEQNFGIITETECIVTRGPVPPSVVCIEIRPAVAQTQLIKCALGKP